MTLLPFDCWRIRESDRADSVDGIVGRYSRIGRKRAVSRVVGGGKEGRIIRCDCRTSVEVAASETSRRRGPVDLPDCGSRRDGEMGVKGRKTGKERVIGEGD